MDKKNLLQQKQSGGKSPPFCSFSQLVNMREKNMKKQQICSYFLFNYKIEQKVFIDKFCGFHLP